MAEDGRSERRARVVLRSRSWRCVGKLIKRCWATMGVGGNEVGRDSFASIYTY